MSRFSKQDLHPGSYCFKSVAKSVVPFVYTNIDLCQAGSKATEEVQHTASSSLKGEHAETAVIVACCLEAKTPTWRPLSVLVQSAATDSIGGVAL